MSRINSLSWSQSTALKSVSLSSVNVKININNECLLVLSKQEVLFTSEKKAFFFRAGETGRNRMGTLLLKVLIHVFMVWVRGWRVCWGCLYAYGVCGGVSTHSHSHMHVQAHIHVCVHVRPEDERATSGVPPSQVLSPSFLILDLS